MNGVNTLRQHLLVVCPQSDSLQIRSSIASLLSILFKRFQLLKKASLFCIQEVFHVLRQLRYVFTQPGKFALRSHKDNYY